MSDTNTKGGYTRNELNEYRASSKKLNEDKACIDDMLILLTAFGGHEFRQRTNNLGYIPSFKVGSEYFDLVVEQRLGTGLRLVLSDKVLREIVVLQIGKNGRYATENIPTQFVAPLRELMPQVYDIVQKEYGGLRDFLEDIRSYAQ